jgi:hypothetical protein
MTWQVCAQVVHKLVPKLCGQLRFAIVVSDTASLQSTVAGITDSIATLPAYACTARRLFSHFKHLGSL